MVKLTTVPSMSLPLRVGMTMLAASSRPFASLFAVSGASFRICALSLPGRETLPALSVWVALTV
ncbi:hypothetical protein ODY53_15315, partial [Aeromonas veronii]|uniref:hypothetical protein n=1 Tax=Aeromonas veronii TaxID=654 RepID=UPI002247ED6B